MRWCGGSSGDVSPWDIFFVFNISLLRFLINRILGIGRVLRSEGCGWADGEARARDGT